MSVFEYKDYKRFLLKMSSKKRGSISLWAKKSQCQPSYLSQVLHGKPHITMDQAFLLSEALDLDFLEQEYFVALVELGRASTPHYQKYLDSKLQTIKDRSAQLSDKIKNAEVQSEKTEMTYFSVWFYAAIHLLIATKNYQTIEEISERLDINQELVREILKQLVDIGLAEKKGDKWVYSGGSILLPKDSPMFARHNDSWRRKAIEKTYLREKNEIYTTALFTMSKKEQVQFHKIILEAMEQFRQIAEPAESEEVFCLNLDFFKI